MKYILKQRMTKDGRGTDNFDLFLDGKEGNPAAYYVTTAIATFHTERLAKEVLEYLNTKDFPSFNIHYQLPNNIKEQM